MTEKILIVDDDVDSLKLIGLMLQRHGYEVVAANSGGQALAKADAERPNLIILDVMMPDMNGLEVCKRLRANNNTKKIPIIMFTAKTMIDDKVKGFEAGADDYLTKPTHPAELASRVKAMLERNPTAAGPNSPVDAPVVRQSRGTTVGVLGSKGGVGTTTVALNLAASLLQSGDQPLVGDFQLGIGSMGIMLGLGRSQGMARLMMKAPNEIVPQLIEGEIAVHQSGLRALLCSIRPKEAHLNYHPDTPLAIVRQVKNLSRSAIFDMGHGLTTLNAKIVAEMERLILVVEPNSAALLMARELIREIESEVASNRINVVVMNRTQSTMQTPWHEVENMLGREVKVVITAAPELAFQAIENAVPIVLLQPGSVVAGQFVKLAETLRSRIRPIA